MPKIIHKKKELEERSIQVGDVFHTEENNKYFIFSEHPSGEGYMLIDIEDMCPLRHTYNHVAHVMNYLKKHYGGFKIIWHDQYFITIAE